MKTLREIPELTKPGDIKNLAIFHYTKGSFPDYTINAFEKFYEKRGIKIISTKEPLGLIDSNKYISEAVEMLLIDISQCDTVAFADNWHRMPLAYTIYMLCRELGIRIVKLGTFDEMRFDHKIEISEVKRKLNNFNETIPRDELHSCKIEQRSTVITKKS